MSVTYAVPKLGIPAADSIFQTEDFAGGGGILAAVSGGGDSLALLFLLYEYLHKQGQENRLAAITIDHNLREESAAEAAYVADLCKKSGIRHEILYWEEGKTKPKLRLQEKARAARYQLLAQAAEKYKADSICTAHTLDDQAETYFMRKSRFAGTAEKTGCFAALSRRGLACMARSSLLYGKFRLLRPLLNIRRSDLRGFLEKKEIKWQEDPSNEDHHYERVRIRRNLTETDKEQACAAVSVAAVMRQDLSAAAALWGKKLALRQEGEKLLLYLAPVQKQNGLKDRDFAALYLLLATGAVFCSGKNFIAPNNARLKRFLFKLPQHQKGEKPVRISVSGAVLEKRQGQLTIKRERRISLKPETGIGCPEKDKAALPQGVGPFDFIIPAYDRPLFLIFRSLPTVNTAKNEKTCKKKAAFLPGSLGKGAKAAYVKGKL